MARAPSHNRAPAHTLEDVLKLFRGMTAAQIAAQMASAGIRGRSGTTHSCPLAILLTTTHTGSFIVGRRYIVRRSGNNIDKARTPRNLVAFMTQFDQGKWSQLMAPPPRCCAGARHAPKRSSGKRTARGSIKHHLAKLASRFND